MYDICKLLDDICNDQRYKDTKAFNTNRRRNGNTTEQKIKDQRKKKRQYNWTEDKGPKERRNGNTTKQKIKDQKKEETAIQLNRR